jgi:hypothetical protein
MVETIYALFQLLINLYFSNFQPATASPRGCPNTIIKSFRCNRIIRVTTRVAPTLSSSTIISIFNKKIPKCGSPKTSQKNHTKKPLGLCKIAFTKQFNFFTH